MSMLTQVYAILGKKMKFALTQFRPYIIVGSIGVCYCPMINTSGMLSSLT